MLPAASSGGADAAAESMVNAPRVKISFRNSVKDLLVQRDDVAPTKEQTGGRVAVKRTRARVEEPAVVE